MAGFVLEGELETEAAAADLLHDLGRTAENLYVISRQVGYWGERCCPALASSYLVSRERETLTSDSHSTPPARGVPQIPPLGRHRLSVHQATCRSRQLRRLERTGFPLVAWTHRSQEDGDGKNTQEVRPGLQEGGSSDLGHQQGTLGNWVSADQLLPVLLIRKRSSFTRHQKTKLSDYSHHLTASLNSVAHKSYLLALDRNLPKIVTRDVPLAR